MDEKKIKRINELYKKSKGVGLTETELEEQANLRNEYRMSILGNISNTLSNVKIKEKDGSITDLKPKGN